MLKLLNIVNSIKPSDCGNCAELELQLLQSLNELSSVQMIVDLLSKEHKHKQDKPTLDIVRNDQWTRVSSNQQKKPKSIGEKSICYTPTTINRFELLSNLTTNADVCRPEKDSEIRNYSGCLQGKICSQRKHLYGQI